MLEKGEVETLPAEVKTVQIGAVIDYVTGCPADRVLTNITLIDDAMEEIQTAIQQHVGLLAKQREQLLERAKAEGIKEDGSALLVEKLSKKNRNKIENLEAFTRMFPDGVREIRMEQQKELERKHAKALKVLRDSPITLGMADNIIGEKEVTAFV